MPGKSGMKRFFRHSPLPSFFDGLLFSSLFCFFSSLFFSSLRHNVRDCLHNVRICLHNVRVCLHNVRVRLHNVQGRLRNVRDCANNVRTCSRSVQLRSPNASRCDGYRLHTAAENQKRRRARSFTNWGSASCWLAKQSPVVSRQSSEKVVSSSKYFIGSSGGLLATAMLRIASTNPLFPYKRDCKADGLLI